MTQQVKVVVKAPSVSGDVDEMENTWAWQGPTVGTISTSGVVTDLAAFYAALGSSFWSSELSASVPWVVEFYDISAHLNGSPHGPPFHISSMANPIPTTGDGCPGQIAMVCDFHGDLSGVAEFGAGTRPRARLRGRVHLGPIQKASVVPETTTNIPKFSSTITAAATAALHTLAGSSSFGSGWGVWSRKNAAIVPIVGGWVDATPHRARKREEPTAAGKQFWTP